MKYLRRWVVLWVGVVLVLAGCGGGGDAGGNAATHSITGRVTLNGP